MSTYIINNFRDISKFMKQNNVQGSSKGYVQRVISSYAAVSVIAVRKYFLSTLKFCQFYMQGETGFTVNQKMKYLRKTKKCHRGAVLLEVDHSKKVYARDRF